MPCGCGCGAYFGGDYGEQEIFQVTSECGLGTGFEYTEDAVINTWNEANGMASTTSGGKRMSTLLMILAYIAVGIFGLLGIGFFSVLDYFQNN